MNMERADWRDEAACLHADPDLFLPGGTVGPALRQVDEAKRDLPDLPGADTVPELGTRPGQLLGHLGRHHRG
jgi:WhiB family transcriptional regulator, redox-sensing transcriptional regulator